MALPTAILALLPLVSLAAPPPSDPLRSSLLGAAAARTRARAAAAPALRDPALALAPQQLHLALTGDPTEMLVMWVTYNISNGTVAWGAAGGGAPTTTAAAALSTYTGGLLGWEGWLRSLNANPTRLRAQTRTLTTDPNGPKPRQIRRR